MILFINLCIHWAAAALTASYMEAESYGAEPEENEAMRIANIYLTSGSYQHLLMVKHEFHFPIGEVRAQSLKHSDSTSETEFCSEAELEDIRQHHADCDLYETSVVYYYTEMDDVDRWIAAHS